ncbi:MAG: UDP-N-acetylglucosamine--N-acetylmuramyl-(pentapeptide) pyrophosphoryl-undecaprenol N-acetylglucosamine transferase, partial [Clostridia bacterium]|nr:UDP-N-acetylglucosamine--N-acetylmuramyl-(pentapeptide) pyrophosphoryl-undecaprenol N-acetylglucosamine transferase [Clostridia bacterium]
MRVLLTGGGTAGHINPALSIAAAVKRRMPDTEFLFVGAEGRMETELVPKAGYPIRTIVVKGFSRKLTPAGLAHNLSAAYHAVVSGRDCNRILREFKPDVAVGTGGYVCGPILRKAAQMGIPVVVHESNALPGITTRMLSKYATVCLPSEAAQKRMPAGSTTVITGNPIRPDFLGYDREQARRELSLDDRPLVLSLGGSLGAAKINESMTDVLRRSHALGTVQHIHATGKAGYDAVCDALTAAGVPLHADGIQVRAYIDDMPRCMAAADLVVCRCGAMTTTELLACGKPSILIPSPNVAENHQFYNAMALVDRGAAKCIEEKDLTGERLWQTVSDIV